MTSTALDTVPPSSGNGRLRKPPYRKLRPGPGRSPAEVQADQRTRLRTAMVELAAERGYEGIRVRALARLAGVSTRSVYKHFLNTEECFVATYESVTKGAARRASAAIGKSRSWEEGIRVGLRVVLRDVVKHQKEAQLVLVEAFVAGSVMRPRMREAHSAFERLLLEGPAATRDDVAVSELIARGVVAGVIRVTRSRLMTGRTAELEGIGWELGDWVLHLCTRYAIDLEPPEPHLAVSANGWPQSEESIEEPASAILGGLGDEEGRILAAVAKLGAAGGFSRLTMPRIRVEAGVSRRKLDSRFADVGDCFLTAVEALVATTCHRADEQAAGAADWEARVYRLVDALCAEAAEHPALTRLAFVGIFAPGRQGLQCKKRLTSLAAAWLRDASPPARRPSELVAEASSAAAWGIAQAEVEAGRSKNLPNLAPLIAYVLLAPTVGASAAAEAIEEERARSSAPR